ncbi:MAG: Asp-tRNA(Asn)/Glu-tRNA(Gln) amidotransferase subunit GatC [Alphaproteobacteria bacterium]|nr:Asp-tRNA(Asn)/Glu-tRNA(Gln) amidotransferase subunit GatC [Alphaproteobacteria bacterium]
MSIDKTTVARIARLARMKVPDEQLEQVAGELNQILDWVAMLDEVDVKNVPPMQSVHDMPLRWREDKVTDGARAGDILSAAPSRTADFFTVPKVVE